MRQLKVYEAPGSVSKNTPCIRLQGRWMEELGFKTGSGFTVHEDEGKLVIELIEKELVDYNKIDLNKEQNHKR